MVHSPFLYAGKKGSLLKYTLIIMILVLNGCYKKGEAISPNKIIGGDTINTVNVTYDNYIHGLLKSNCSTCHGPKGSAELWWLNENTYENAVKDNGPISGTMINGTMPPPPKFPFLQKDRELIRAWIEKGMPRN